VRIQTNQKNEGEGREEGWEVGESQAKGRDRGEKTGRICSSFKEIA